VNSTWSLFLLNYTNLHNLCKFAREHLVVNESWSEADEEVVDVLCVTQASLRVEGLVVEGRGGILGVK